MFPCIICFETYLICRNIPNSAWKLTLGCDHKWRQLSTEICTIYYFSSLDWKISSDPGKTTPWLVLLNYFLNEKLNTPNSTRKLDTITHKRIGFSREYRRTH